MEKVKRRKKIDISPDELNEIIVDLIQDRKGKDIKSLHLEAIPEAVTDYFIICNGDSSTQVRAIADHIEEDLKEKRGIRAFHVEGKSYGEWCLLDYGSIIVHVFTKEKRDYYQLEELWCDAKIKEYENIN
ncbi:MAG: ribosome silencing factor [Chitinophagales bacterium]|nr:ribosome silencing factor [Chitinophagales bacterium]